MWTKNFEYDKIMSKEGVAVKKFIFVLCFLAIIPVKAQAITLPSTVRIGLIYNSVSTASIPIVASGGYQVVVP